MANKKSKAKKSTKKAVKTARKQVVNFSAKVAVRLYKAGKTISAIAQKFGYKQGTGQNRIRYALTQAGEL